MNTTGHPPDSLAAKFVRSFRPPLSIVIAATGLALSSHFISAQSADELAGLKQLQAQCHKLIVEQYKLAEAGPVVERLLALTLKLRGEIHQDTVVALHWSGYLAYKAGNYSEAAGIWERSLAMQEKLPEKDSFWHTRTLHVLGGAYRAHLDFPRAEAVLKQAYELRKKTLGADHPDTVKILRSIGRVHDVQAKVMTERLELSKAEAALKKSLEFWEHAFGPNDAATLEVRKKLGRLCVQRGDFGQAEELFLGVLKSYEAQGSEADLDVAETLFALADLYLDIRDLDKAEPLLARATQMFEKLLGHDHVWIGHCLAQSGVLRIYRGDVAGADELVQQSLRLKEKLDGPDGLDLYWPLHLLAEIRIESDEFSEAEVYLKRVLKIVQARLGPEHPRVIHTLKMLGHVRERRGDYLPARDYFEKACRLASRQPDTTEYSAEHCCRALARMEFVLGDREAALAAADQIQDRESKRLARVLSFTSERQRLDYLSRYGSGGGINLWATIGAAGPLARAVLRSKGLVLDSLVEDRLLAETTGDLQLLQKRDELIRLKRQLAFHPMSELSNEPDAKQMKSAPGPDFGNLAQQAEALEASLARNINGLGRSRRAFTVQVEQVREVLPERAGLVEYLRYDHYLGRGEEEARYGALVMSPHDEPKWIPLGKAEIIEKNLKLYQHLIRRQPGDDSLSPLLRELYRQLWAPLAQALPADLNQVILCPDAQLNFLSFATLLNASNCFLGEEFALSYVSSGRDLLAAGKPAPQTPQLLVWANPDFGESTVESAPATQFASLETVAVMRELRGLNFRPLPGAEKEGRLLHDRAASLGFARSTLHLGRDATEAELARIQSPAVLHLATHGFVLPEAVSADGGNKPGTANPMLRSGLALAGARHTLEAWARGDTVPPENDGIISAAEIGCLNLRETQLVVLSACDTGLGEARAGEGVLGLRRGFIQAGAQNLLLTLWPVEDEGTAAFMSGLYTAVIRTGHPALALAEVQRDWLKKLRMEKGVAKACQIAGPFILSFQGKPVVLSRNRSHASAR